MAQPTLVHCADSRGFHVPHGASMCNAVALSMSLFWESFENMEQKVIHAWWALRAWNLSFSEGSAWPRWGGVCLRIASVLAKYGKVWKTLSNSNEKENNVLVMGRPASEAISEVQRREWQYSYAKQIGQLEKRSELLCLRIQMNTLSKQGL